MSPRSILLASLRRSGLASLDEPVTATSAESGHAAPVLGVLLSAAGTILLGIGAAGDTGWLAVVGGIVAAVGAFATLLLNHTQVEYPIYSRLDELEKKK